MIVAGFGYRSGASVEDLRIALQLTGVTPQVLTSLDEKAQGPLRAFATALQLPLIPISKQRLRGIDTPTRSPRIMALFATGSLAEAAALVAAGPGSSITIARVASPNGMATAAIAQGPTS